MNGILLWESGHYEMADKLDLSDPSGLPQPWPVELEAFGPWQPVALPEDADSRFRVSARRSDAPTLFVAGASSSAMALAWRMQALGLLPEWGSVICISQRQGVGQMGRTWESPPGNLYAAVRLPDAVAAGPHAGSLVAGYWIAHLLRELDIPAQLKWPNDIVVDERKAGGILIQNRSGVMVAGIGLNLASAPPPERLRGPRAIQAVSLSETGVATTPLQLWCRLLDRGNHFVREALALDPLSFRDRIHDLLAFRGRGILVDDHTGETYPGTLMGLSETGELEILVGSQLKTIRSGSIYPRDGS